MAAAVDPLAVVVAYLKQGALGAAVAGRVATQHHYGRAWTHGDPGAVVALERQWQDVPGTVRCRMRVHLYAPDSVTVSALYQTLREDARWERFTVVVGQGQALVYFLLADVGFWSALDETTGMHEGVCPILTMMAEEVMP